MRDNGIRDTINTLIDTDPACLDQQDLKDGLARLRHVQGWAAAGILEYTRRLTQIASEANAPCPAGNAATELSIEMGLTSGEAQSAVDQADLCDTNAGLGDSLAAGEITERHLRLIAKFRKPLTPVEQSDFDQAIDAIHDWARQHHHRYFERCLKELVARIRADHQPDDDGAAELERQRQHSSIKSWVEHDTGLHKVMLTLDPVRVAHFNSAWKAELAALRNQNQHSTESFGSLQIQAVINSMSGGTAAKRATELIVIVDHQTLAAGRHEHGMCETLDGDPLPVPYVQRLCDEAVITLFGTDGSGQITKAVDQRTASRAQRRALAALYRTCAFPNCDVTISNCRMHHIEYHSRGGETKLSNLIPLCETHHHHIHDLGWTLTIDDDTRCATFHPPNGASPLQTLPDRQPIGPPTGADP